MSFGIVGPQQTSHTTIGALLPVGIEDCDADEARADFFDSKFPVEGKIYSAGPGRGRRNMPRLLPPLPLAGWMARHTQLSKYYFSRLVLFISSSPRSSSRLFCPGPSASEEGEFRREQLFCRDAHIWCCVVSQSQDGRGLGITPEASSSEL